MNKTTFIQLATAIFAVLALIHLYRGFMGLPLVVGSWQAPIYVSFIESFLFFILGYLGYRQRHNSSRG
jgi:hypothetical protein